MLKVLWLIFQWFLVAEKEETEIRLSENIFKNREIRAAESKKGIDDKKDITKIKEISRKGKNGKREGKNVNSEKRKKGIKKEKRNKNRNKKENKRGKKEGNGLRKRNKNKDENKKGHKKGKGRRKGIKKGKGKRKINKEGKKKEKPTGITKGKKKENGRRTGNKKGNGNKKGKKKKTPTGIRKGSKNMNRNKEGNKSKKRKFNQKNQMKMKDRKKTKSDPGQLTGRQSCDVSTTCFETAVNFLKIWKDLVINFDQQKNRMTKQNKTGGKSNFKKQCNKFQFRQQIWKERAVRPSCPETYWSWRWK